MATMPCGDTAAWVEDRIGPFHPVVTTAHEFAAKRRPSRPELVRVHAMVDADNECQDHVAFAAWNWPHQMQNTVSVFDSYIGSHGARQRTVWGVTDWLDSVARLDGVRITEDDLVMTGATFNKQWRETWELHDDNAVAEFAAPLVCEVFVSERTVQAARVPWTDWTDR